MLGRCFLRFFAALSPMLFFVAQPASAGRTVYDTWGYIGLNGYCSPSTGTAGCAAHAMPFSVQMGGTTYNGFYVNSNGTVSFGSIESFLAPQNSPPSPPPQTSLSAYSVPVFSPNFSDGPGYNQAGSSTGYDGNFAAMTSVGTNSFTVNWFTCNSGFPLDCGPAAVNLIANATYDPTDTTDPNDLEGEILSHGSCSSYPCTTAQLFVSGQQNLLDGLGRNPVYTMTLTDLPAGFRVDYSYNAPGQSGVYGFSLPSGTDQVAGPLVDRSYLFNSLGELVAVPEPSTWTELLVGFAIMAISLSKRRRLQSA